MKFTILRGDVLVEISADELEAKELLQQLLAPSANSHTGSQDQNGDGQQPAGNPHGATVVDRVRRLWQVFGNVPRLVLLALFAKPQGLSDIDLKAAVREHDITTLAGSMTAIVKGCKRMEIPLKNVLVKTDFRDRQRGGFFFYKMGKVAREVLEAMKPEERTATKAKEETA